MQKLRTEIKKNGPKSFFRLSLLSKKGVSERPQNLKKGSNFNLWEIEKLQANDESFRSIAS